jgi:catechol 2,3-dioxygenase-like lactoylglutathione lyase family enzyme
MQRLAHIALLVRDYDEAIDFFTRAFDWVVLEDEPRGPGKRWVRIGPRPDAAGADAPGASLLLARAATPEQQLAIGNQSGGRVFLFMHTDDFAASYARLQSAGVRFTESPRHESYGRVVVFLDLYGNKWDLIERPRLPQ